MGDRSFPFLSKRTIIILVTVIIFCAGVFLSVNLVLTLNKDRIEGAISKYLGYPVSFAKIEYRLFSTFQLHKVRLSYRGSDNRVLFFTSSLMRVRVSLKHLLWERQAYIDKVYLKECRINFFLYDNGFLPYLKKIVNALYTPGLTLYSHIDGGEIIFFRTPKERISLYTKASLTFTPKGKIKGRGDVSLFNSQSARYINNKDVIFWDVSLSMEKGGVCVDSIKLRKESFYAQLWGEWEKEILHLKGVISASIFLHAPSSFGPSGRGVGFMKKVFFRQKRKKKVPLIIGASSEFNIFDLDLFLRMTTSEIEIQRLDFSLNGVPVRSSGNFSFSKPHRFGFSFTTYANQSLSSRMKIKDYVNIEGEGVLDGDRLGGAFHIQFMLGGKYELVPVEAVVRVSGLSWDFSRITETTLSCDIVEVSFKKGKVTSYLTFNNFFSRWELKNPRYKFALLSMDFCSGKVEGEGVLDVFRFPPQIYLKMHLRGASANCLKSVSVNFAKIYGELDGDVFYRNYPSFSLWGKVGIEKGHIDKLIFFHWLADFFQLPALDFVDLKHFSADFRVDNNGYALDNIDLTSSLLNMKGYFRIDARNLVSSKVSMIFTQPLLESSPKFKRLLKLLGSDASSVAFNFQLSGPFRAMNFQWQESDFKRRLEELLPSGYERAIENKIEKVIEDISTESML